MEQADTLPPQGALSQGQSSEAWGRPADELHYWLTREMRWQPGKCQWKRSDHESLHYLSQLDHSHESSWSQVDSGNLPQGIGLALDRRFHSQRDTFYDALPFSRPEGAWLVNAYRMLNENRGLFEVPDVIRKQEAEVMTSGVRHVVKGRDLMRRWWAWRRETAEFEGQGSLVIACAALAETIDLTFPGSAASIRQAARFPEA